MSRSYKKHPWVTDGTRGQVISKRFANKTVRNYKHKIANGKSYKKLFCSYDIHDFKMYFPWYEAKKEYEKEDFYKSSYPTFKEFYRYWSKTYKWK